jgi:hypothetical protein
VHGLLFDLCFIFRREDVFWRLLESIVFLFSYGGRSLLNTGFSLETLNIVRVEHGLSLSQKEVIFLFDAFVL